MCERRFNLGASPGRPARSSRHCIVPASGRRSTITPLNKFSNPANRASGSEAGESRTSCGVPVATILPRVEEDEPFAEREHLAMRVRDVEHRDGVRGVPGAQVVDDARRGRVIERGQRFVEQQHHRVGDE